MMIFFHKKDLNAAINRSLQTTEAKEKSGHLMAREKTALIILGRQEAKNT